MRLNAIFCAWGLLGVIAPVASRADAPVVGKVLRHIPRTDEQLAAAHAKSRYACRQIAEGQPLRIDAFAGTADYLLSPREKGDKAAGQERLRLAFSRQPALTFGLDMQAGDRANLPLLTGGFIQDRIDKHYISIQVRIHRDPDGGEPYLYHRPYAAVGEFSDTQTAASFSDLMAASVRDVRGLGLFLKPGETLKPESLRTLVAVSKGAEAIDDVASGEIRVKPYYELLLVRARVDGGASEADMQVTLHSFATTEGRSILHYLEQRDSPANPAECALKSTICFTGYTLANQNPSASATRHVDFNARTTFPMARLDALVRERGLTGDALDNLTDVLDWIIDDKIPLAAAGD